MKNYSIQLLLVSALLGLTSSCAMIQKLSCNSDSARTAGTKDASEGRTDQPSLRSGASYCEGSDFSQSQYTADYKAGFEEKRNKMCQISEVTNQASADGLNSVAKENTLKKLATCGSLSNYKTILSTYENNYQTSFCGAERAKKLGEIDGQQMSAKQYETHFSTCKMKTNLMAMAYERSYTTTYENALRLKQQQFVSSTATSVINVNQKTLTAVCAVTPDQSSVKVTVNNPNAEQMMLQGLWNYKYFDKQFNQITTDSTTEAVLMPPGSAKTFLKMTLPRDASFCRAEYASGQMPVYK